MTTTTKKPNVMHPVLLISDQHENPCNTIESNCWRFFCFQETKVAKGKDAKNAKLEEMLDKFQPGSVGFTNAFVAFNVSFE